ncbi:hypothetical protein DFH08DRAFT_923145 [Mycena albidolilacea]|uniref:Microbial-type PARG catalytic domain-containing protein n=1 Tax=Mycena albidolilacea TaxID=1033008 RepID=A0AAD7A8C0_9AGAR|nr:hypothetical protein DFH08DRAFT_923145 [Mycena albidolilacea]
MTAVLREIAKGTLDAISAGRVTVKGSLYDLSGLLAESRLQTAYYAPDSLLAAWRSFSPAQPHPAVGNTVLEFLETTTLDAARGAGLKGYKRPIGVLNFASAEQPGGGFINGAQAQEESLARSSTLYASLMTPTAQQFYALHAADARDGFYTHAMVYSPHVVVFRADDGTLVPPMEIDVLTSPAVHAGRVRRRAAGAAVERDIRRVMRERMARVLFLFERRQVRHLVLGSFGTGVFQNDVDMVAQIWAELLCGPGARFARSFQYVAFAVMDNPTYLQFKHACIPYLCLDMLLGRRVRARATIRVVIDCVSLFEDEDESFASDIHSAQRLYPLLVASKSVHT